MGPSYEPPEGGGLKMPAETPAERMDALGPQPAAPVKLTRAQRRDLQRMAAAAVMSVAFFSAPLLRPDRGSVEAPAPEVATAAGFDVKVVTTDVAAAATTPQLLSARPVARPVPRIVRARHSVRPESARIAAKAAVQSARSGNSKSPRTKGFSNGLARLITGDGRYSVRPFPTVDPGPH